MPPTNLGNFIKSLQAIEERLGPETRVHFLNEDLHTYPVQSPLAAMDGDGDVVLVHCQGNERWRS